MILKPRKVFSAVHTSIIVLSLVSSPLAQTPRETLGIRRTAARGPQATGEEKKDAKDLEKKALALIDELVTEAMSLRLVENRVYVLTTGSDAIWARDEERARALVREAMDQVVAQMREMKEKATQEDWERFDSRYYHHMVLDLLARHDAKLALEFLQLTRSLRPEARQERALELSLASQIADSDAQTALRIAEKYLDGKLDYNVIAFWGALLRKDPKAASPLTKRIIGNLKSRDILADHDASDCIYRVLDVLKSRADEIADARNNPDAANAARLDSTETQQALRDALEIVVAAALKVTAAQLQDFREAGRARNLLTRAQTFLPDIEQLLPSRAPAVRAKLTQFDEALRLPPATQVPPWEDLENMLKNKSPDELIAMAAESRDEFKFVIYVEAAVKLIEQGDTARSRQILKGFAPSKEYFELMKPLLDRIEEKGREQERERAMKEGKLGAARAEAEAQLNSAAASLDLDPDRSFEILGSALDRLNTVLIALAPMTKFDQRGALSLSASNVGDGEMLIYEFDTINLAADLNDRLLAFARKDFDRTVALLKRWQVNEARLMVCLLLSKRILGAEKTE